MRVAIHQPNYLPWIGYFHKIALVDCFVFFDDVQLPQGKSFCSRVKIKGPSGGQWLTVPVHKSSGMLIREVTIAGHAWVDKHLRTIAALYGRCPYYDDYLDVIECELHMRHDFLADMNCRLIESLCRAIGLGTTFVRSSELLARPVDPVDHIPTILEALDATIYVTGDGAGSRRYVNKDRLSSIGVDLERQHFEHPHYTQVSKLFEPLMSVIDLLFNQGPGWFHQVESAIVDA